MAADPARTRLGGAGVAGRIRRLRLEPDPALHLQPRVAHWPERPRCRRWASGWSPTRSSSSARDAQKEYFLPRILTGEVFFCQGYSEPEAGLGSGRAVDGGGRRRRRPGVHRQQDLDDARRARRTGCSRWCARRAAQKKQQGITFVLIDMTSPGIQIRPLVMTSGEEVQNQVFFDEVRVPEGQCPRRDRRRLDRRQVSAGVRARRRRVLAGAAGDGRGDRHRGRRAARSRRRPC